MEQGSVRPKGTAEKLQLKERLEEAINQLVPELSDLPEQNKSNKNKFYFKALEILKKRKYAAIRKFEEDYKDNIKK